jgi:hypothetical protein
MTIGTTAKNHEMALVFQVIEMSRIRSGRRNDKERLEEERDDDNSSELINYNFIVSFGLTIYTHILFQCLI